MKLNFEQLNKIVSKLHETYQEDNTEADPAFYGGRHVYSINIEPEKGIISVHVQWPMFVQLVANEADHPAECTTHDEGKWLHWRCHVQKVEITACCMRDVVVKMLEDIKEVDFHWTDEDTVADLIRLCQNYTGWDLDWEAKNV